MPVEERWPLPYSGLPSLLMGISMVCFTVGILATLLNASISILFTALGAVLSLLSAGKQMEVSGSGIVLSYGFPIAVLRYVVRDIVKVFDVKELDRGTLLRYFKYHLFVFNTMIALPILYLVLRGTDLNLVYLPILLIPILVGVVLQLHTVFTANSYRKFVTGMMVVLGLIWISIGLIVGVTQWKSLLVSSSSAARFFISMLFPVLLIALYIGLAGRRHIVIVESGNGRFYAIGTLTAEDAKRLIREILEVMARDAEATS